jgi:LuxR family maltose regulon positive regulatory protein
LCREALAYAEARDARQFRMVGYVLVKLGNLLYERNDLSEAEDYVTEGVALMQGWQQPYEMVVGYTSLSAILCVLNSTDMAREALRKAKQIQDRHPDYTKLSSLVNIGRVRLALAQGGAEEAARRAAEVRLGEARALIDRERERMMLARVQIAQERWDEAMRLLLPLLEDARTGGRLGHVIQLLVLQAVVWQQQGNTARALNVLEQALSLGEPEGHVRTFLDQDATLAALLAQAVARDLMPDYAARLLAASGEDVAIPSPSPDASALIEALTDRELEVLDLISRGYSNQDIVDALVISLNTVKKHASNIYGKLGVRSRTQAVARAQELGLL